MISLFEEFNTEVTPDDVLKNYKLHPHFSVLKKVFGHAPSEDLSKISRFEYTNESPPISSSTGLNIIDPVKQTSEMRINIVPGDKNIDTHIKNITTHELSHHLDRHQQIEDVKKGNTGDEFSRISLRPVRKYLGSESEFVARGGVSHIEHLDNPDYVASGLPTLKEQIKNLRQTSDKIPEETRSRLHHHEPFKKGWNDELDKEDKAHEGLIIKARSAKELKELGITPE